MTVFDVMVYDDDCTLGHKWARSVEALHDGARVEPAGEDAFHQLIELLTKRRAEWRRPEIRTGMISDHPVDHADVVIVDYDLLGYSRESDTTGSRLAYLLRCFSGCGFIIVLNEHGTNSFDLRLTTSTDEFADLHVGDAQIGNPGLWGTGFEGYRPWHWPVVPHAAANFGKCVEDVLENPSATVLEFFGLDEYVDWIPWRAHDFMATTGKIEDITLWNFATSGPGGLDPKDELIPTQVARVAAARIGAMLNSIIFPEQGLLVDAPHLVSRYPSLIADSDRGVDALNRFCDPTHDLDGLLTAHLVEHKFRKPHWLWRPAWYWPAISRDETVDEVRDPYNFQELDSVFCEDISRFVPSAAANDFRAIVSSSFFKRYRFDSHSPDAAAYVIQTGKGGPSDPISVQYIPQSALID